MLPWSFSSRLRSASLLLLFFFNATATTEIYTLSLHDALPISRSGSWDRWGIARRDPPVPGSWRRRRASPVPRRDRKSTRLNSSHTVISYAVFCLKKKRNKQNVERLTAHISLLDRKVGYTRVID